MVAGIAPVESGHVASLARPGISITGFVAKLPGLAGKALELLREILPHALHIFVKSSELGSRDKSKSLGHSSPKTRSGRGERFKSTSMICRWRLPWI
jgi:hypothetical protein